MEGNELLSIFSLLENLSSKERMGGEKEKETEREREREKMRERERKKK